jgi:hypothetical protein
MFKFSKLNSYRWCLAGFGAVLCSTSLAAGVPPHIDLVRSIEMKTKMAPMMTTMDIASVVDHWRVIQVQERSYRGGDFGGGLIGDQKNGRAIKRIDDGDIKADRVTRTPRSKVIDTPDRHREQFKTLDRERIRERSVSPAVKIDR